MGGVSYQFRVLYFGLTTAPHVFTRLMAPISAILHRYGVRMLRYLDDWLILAESRTTGLQARDRLLQVCEELGLQVNFRKSSLIPSQDMTYLGMQIQSVRFIAKPTETWVENLLKIIEEFLSSLGPPAALWRRLLDHLSSLSLLVKGGLLRMRSLLIRLRSKWDFRDELLRIPWDPLCQEDLLCWSWAIQKREGVDLSLPVPDLSFYSDASDVGWSAIVGEYQVSGVWTPSQRELSINLREMMAVQNGLEFGSLLRGKTIALFCDNVTTVAYLSQLSHLEHNKLILDSQHGFRSGRSCLTNLVDFFHDMFSIYYKSRAVDIIYLDFRKAFDKVPHKRLMAKVRSLGIVDEVGDWIEDWLSDRKQRVVINGTSSGWRDVTSGVPQGSVLGPLLFIIYINDLDLGLVSKISKFADDTKMGINADSDAAVKQLQEDLRKVGEWSKKWQMPFNLDKCKIMHIGHKNKNEKYELLGKEIESVQQEKDLGVVITNDLKSSNQCIEAVKKAQKLLGYIKRQFRTRNRETILTLYNALVRPHLEYAVQFWSPSLRKDIERLEALQARATKLIPSIRHLGYVRRLERLNLYSLEKRRLRGQLIETFKMLKGVNNIDSGICLLVNRTRSNGCWN